MTERKEAVRALELDALQKRLVVRSLEFEASAMQDGRGMAAIIDASIASTLAVVAREIRDLIRPSGEGKQEVDGE